MLETSLITSPARAVLLTVFLALGCTTIHAPSDSGTAGDGAACSCTGRECGDDGCGATCGFCSAGETCVDGMCGDCVRSCTGRECGDDGCMGSCGTCPPLQVCTVAGQCEGECVPDCEGRHCGVDSCGAGSCGTCPAGESCEEGTCTPICMPSCVGRECGVDSCGTGSCGTCPAGESCEEGTCACAPSCAGRECGPTSCGTGNCGTCPSGESCSESGTCEVICVPNCAGRECGSNGCSTGSCGTCGTGDVCNAAGQCVCATPVTCYRDYDGDGYANMRTTCSMSQCECPAGYIEARPDGAWDCNDTLPEIHPGADYGPPSPCVSRDASCGSGLSTVCSEPLRDLNCDGTVQRRWATVGGGCVVGSTGCRVVGSPGWRTSVPDCGVEGDWFLGTCTSTCSPLYLRREQECR